LWLGYTSFCHGSSTAIKFNCNRNEAVVHMRQKGYINFGGLCMSTGSGTGLGSMAGITWAMTTAALSE